MAITTRTQYVCDRCGWDSEKSPRQRLDDFGHLNVQWNGVSGGYGWDGSSGGASIQDKAYLCLDCLRSFLKFMKMDPQKEAQLSQDIAHWVQLAKAQRDWFEEHGPHGKSTCVCPTDAAIEASEKLLGRTIAYPKALGDDHA